MGNSGMRFLGNFASLWKIFTDFLNKKNCEMKFLKTIFEVFVVSRQSSYVIVSPTH